jgi:tetratricopeptide (TPR) repeat protein
MKIDRKPMLFILLSFFCFFMVITNASGQSEFNPRALEYFKRSLECLIIGDYDNAIINCTIVLRYEPNSAVTYTIRARAHYEKGDMANAIADATHAISLDRNNISARTIRGNAYIRSGNFDRAIADWQTILRLDPENDDARRNIELARERRES